MEVKCSDMEFLKAKGLEKVVFTIAIPARPNPLFIER